MNAAAYVSAQYPGEFGHEPTLTIKTSPNRAKRVEAVQMVVIHWTGGTFASAVDWCTRKESEVSYHEVISETGDVVQLVPFTHSAWANGNCRNPDPQRFTWRWANSAADNIALAGGPSVPVTPTQYASLVRRVVERFRARGWPADETWRIVGHCDIATYPDDYAIAALRGKYGRKSDAWGHEWVHKQQLRADVAEQLQLKAAA